MMAKPTISELKEQVQVIENSYKQILRTEAETKFSASGNLLDKIDQLVKVIEQLMKNCVVTEESGSELRSSALADNSATTTVWKEFIELWQLEGSLNRVQRELFKIATQPDLHDQSPHNDSKLDVTLTLKKPLPGDESKRLSQRLGLEFPYDWSNSRMDLNVLVIQVLKRYRFNDVLTLSEYLGSKQLHSVAENFFHEGIPSRLSQILRSIGRAEKRIRSRKLGFANAKLSGFKSTPELDAIVERFIDGEISIEEALTEGKIRRYFEFEIVVALPKGANHEDFLEDFEKLCPNACCSVGVSDRIALRFERSAISREEAINESLQEINEVIPNAKIISVK